MTGAHCLPQPQDLWHRILRWIIEVLFQKHFLKGMPDFLVGVIQGINQVCRLIVLNGEVTRLKKDGDGL